eukprot:m.39636 g.39636  ORF g.39636 m.39636 type:complete len:1221 (-) comp5570_c0_seq2:480-4142(-)
MEQYNQEFGRRYPPSDGRAWDHGSASERHVDTQTEHGRWSWAGHHGDAHMAATRQYPNTQNPMPQPIQGIPGLDPVWRQPSSEPSWKRHQDGSSLSDSARFSANWATRQPTMRGDSGAPSTGSHGPQPSRAITDPSPTPLHDSQPRMLSAPEMSRMPAARSRPPSSASIASGEEGERRSTRPPLIHQSTEEFVDKGYSQLRGWQPTVGSNPLVEAWEQSRAPSIVVERTNSDPARRQWKDTSGGSWPERGHSDGWSSSRWEHAFSAPAPASARRPTLNVPHWDMSMSEGANHPHSQHKESLPRELPWLQSQEFDPGRSMYHPGSGPASTATAGKTPSPIPGPGPAPGSPRTLQTFPREESPLRRSASALSRTPHSASPSPLPRGPSYESTRYGSPFDQPTWGAEYPTSGPSGSHATMSPLMAPHGSSSPFMRNRSVSAVPAVSQPRRDSGRRAETPRRDADSPTTKDRYKDFARGLHQEEKQSYDAAKEFFEATLPSLPERCHFRALLEMADIAKRDNHVEDARSYFERASVANPQGAQIWLEWAKLEEECGELEACQSILKQGLAQCPLFEALLIKGIKHEERMGNIPGARSILAQLAFSDPDKTWRMLSEGAMLEAREGRTGVARLVYRYLIAAVPSHGPVFYEAVKLEEHAGCYDTALRIAEKGINTVPRYGPLWFVALRLLEKLQYRLVDLRSTISRALQVVSRELVWKVWYERAQFEARAGLLGDARVAYANAIRYCPPNLRWKIWLGSSRTELSDGHMLTARALLNRATLEVPRKTRAVVLLERSRLEEFDGKIEQAREILQTGCTEARFEWKVFLEAVLVEYRAGRIAEAISQGMLALETHPGTGRLWAVLIQLRQSEGEDAQVRMFRRALQQVPKSGEVWCEGARGRMNPLSRLFNLNVARRFLDFAIQFTPQYGDSFVEYLRLELLQAGCTRAIDDLLRASVNADPNYGSLWCHCKQNFLDDADAVLQAALGLLRKELYDLRSLYASALLNCIRRFPHSAICLPCEVVARPMQELARPAGALCVLCRGPIDVSPVVGLACGHTFHEVCAKSHAHPQTTAGDAAGAKCCPLCVEPWCIVHYYVPWATRSSRESVGSLISGLASVNVSPRPSLVNYGRTSSGSIRPLRKDDDDDDIAALLVDVGTAMISAMDKPRRVSVDVDRLETVQVGPEVYTPHDFATGLVQLNRSYCRAAQLPSSARQKLLFGSDFVVP